MHYSQQTWHAAQNTWVCENQKLPLITMVGLSILAGAFIALGAIFATTIAAGTGGAAITAADGTLAYKAALYYGVQRLLMGLVFCVGLILVVVGGAELFTGNNLIVMAWASKKVTTAALLRNWGIVYLGNFVGSVGTALMVFFSGQYKFGGNAIGSTALSIATIESQPGFCSRNLPGNSVQCPGLPGCMDDILRSQHHRQNSGDHLPHFCLCGCWL